MSGCARRGGPDGHRDLGLRCPGAAKRRHLIVRRAGLVAHHARLVRHGGPERHGPLERPGPLERHGSRARPPRRRGDDVGRRRSDLTFPRRAFDAGGPLEARGSRRLAVREGSQNSSAFAWSASLGAPRAGTARAWPSGHRDVGSGRPDRHAAPPPSRVPSGFWLPAAHPSRPTWGARGARTSSSGTRGEEVESKRSRRSLPSLTAIPPRRTAPLRATTLRHDQISAAKRSGHGPLGATFAP